MKIVEIAISNIRSFAYESNPVPIKFDMNGLSLIIGSNGSGKSNLIEIITRIFTNIYGADIANYNEDLQRLVQPNVQAVEIGGVNNRPGSFNKHRNFTDKPSYIKLTLQLEESDLKILQLIKDNRGVLTRIYDRYYIDRTGSSRLFKNNFSIPTQPCEYVIELIETTNQYNEKVLIEKDPNSLIAKYLRDYKIVSTIIEMHNDLLLRELYIELERTQRGTSYQNAIDALNITESTEAIQPLHSLVILMSIQDRVNEANLEYVAAPQDNIGVKTSTLGRTRNFTRQLANKSVLGAMSINQSEAFEILKASLYEECMKAVSGRRSKSEAMMFVNQYDNKLKLLNHLISTFDLKLCIREFDPVRTKLSLALKKSTVDLNIYELSSGQRALMNIASNLVLGNELQALVLIDEVENHLHPATQNLLREMLAALSKQKIQAICITHSPVFVSSATINNTLRVTMQNSSSKVIDCSMAANTNAKSLINVLQYSNGARIFFTDKVLLVEGQSDEEFYTAYIRRFYPKCDIEILSTNTKGQIEPWRRIIEEFGIKVCSITDLDDAKKKEIKRKPNRPKKDGVSLVKADVDNAEYEVLLTNIAIKAQTNRYILKEGALESYVPGSSADKVQRVRDFLEDPKWSSMNHYSEIREITKQVIDS